MVDWNAFIRELGEVPSIDDPVRVRRRSRDFYWYSPILKPLLDDVCADLLVIPRDEDDVIRVASLCARFRAPLTVRGGGTGNYGQCMPLAGGVVMDMTMLDRIKRLDNGILRVQAGAKMGAIDAEIRPQGWELRMFPSTKRTATIGGFVAGGSGGIGSVTFGGLREIGNVVGARAISVEAKPKIVELTGQACNCVNRTYGTTAILTEVELPLAPAMPWRDLVIGFDAFDPAARFGQALAAASGIDKKLVSVMDAPLPAYFRPLDGIVEPGMPIVIAMAAPAAMASIADLCATWRGRLLYDKDAIAAERDPDGTPLYELTWNHTTLRVLKQDRSFTYLQSLFPVGRNLELVEAMRRHFGDEVVMHMEFIRFEGELTNSALQVVRFTTPARLDDIIAYHEANGILIANPHVYTLEDGSRHKRVPGDQMGFKREMDPFGLLNPGKMRSFQAEVTA